MLILALLALLMPTALGQAPEKRVLWSFNCAPLVTERLDGIVNPGGVSGHLHQIFGSSGFAPTLSSAANHDALCTSCPIDFDRSNYWHPNMVFEYADGTFEPLPLVTAPAFYYHAGTNSTIWPEDFQMIFGNPLAVAKDPAYEGHNSLEMSCSDPGGEKGQHWPTKNCDADIRIELSFASCWNGQPDPGDHTSHVTYPVGGFAQDGTGCPSSHPIQTPRIFSETFHRISAFKGRWNEAKNPKQPFRWSNGNGEYWGMHMDFFMGWDRQKLSDAIQNCAYKPNDALKDSDGYRCHGAFEMMDPGKFGKCHKSTSVAEKITGRTKFLLGCNAPFDSKSGKPGAKEPECEATVGLVESQQYEGDKLPAGACYPDEPTRCTALNDLAPPDQANSPSGSSALAPANKPNPLQLAPSVPTRKSADGLLTSSSRRKATRRSRSAANLLPSVLLLVVYFM